MNIHRIVENALSQSIVEEMLSALWLIAGLLAFSAGIKWLAWALFIKAAHDTACSILCAILEHKKMKTSNPSFQGGGTL